MKNIKVFLSVNFEFLEVKFSIYLNKRVFEMVCLFLVCHYSVCHFVFEVCIRDIPYGDNGHIKLHRRKNPLQKLGVKELFSFL